MNLPTLPAPVIAIHCSGADAKQWRKLTSDACPRFDVRAINLIGTAAAGHWPAGAPFAMADETKPVLVAIDARREPVHLVGHSYGGAVALAAALQRVDRIASLTLYEPSSFHMLRQIRPGGRAAHAEIAALADVATRGVASGDVAGAAEVFVDYWNEAGSWAAMKPEARTSFAAWFPKAPLDFAAALGEDTSLCAYRRLRCPTLILRGENAHTPSRRIAETLAQVMPNARLVLVPGAGHMGPVTHAAQVNALIVAHLSQVASMALGLTRAA